MDPEEKKQAVSHAFVQLVVGFPQQLVVCNKISKIAPVPGTYAITFVDPFDFKYGR